MTILKEMLPYLIPVILFIAGSLFAIYQLKLNAITQARIKWIETVGELLSSIVNDIYVVSTEYLDMEEDLIEKEKILSEEEFDKYEEELEKKVDEKIKPYVHKGDRESFQLQLYLNKSNPDHVLLVKLIDDLLDMAWDDDKRRVSQSSVIEQMIVDQGRKIIQEEWDKIFKGSNLNPLY